MSRSLDETSCSALNEGVECLEKHALDLPLSDVSSDSPPSKQTGSARIASTWRNSSVSTIDPEEINTIQIKLKGLAYVDGSRSFIALPDCSPREDSSFEDSDQDTNTSPPRSIQSEPCGFNRKVESQHPPTTDVAPTDVSWQSEKNGSRNRENSFKDPKHLNDSALYIMTKFVQAVDQLGSIITEKGASHLPLGWTMLSCSSPSEAEGPLSRGSGLATAASPTAWEVYQSQNGPQNTIQAMKTFPESADCQAKGCEVLYYYLTWLQLKFVSMQPIASAAGTGSTTPTASRSRRDQGALGCSTPTARRRRQRKGDASPPLSPTKSRSPKKKGPKPPSLEIPAGGTSGESNGDLTPVVLKSRRGSRNPSFEAGLSAAQTGMMHLPPSLERSRLLSAQAASSTSSGRQTPKLESIEHFPLTNLAPSGDTSRHPQRQAYYRSETPPSPKHKGLRSFCWGETKASDERGGCDSRPPLGHEEAGQLAALVRLGAVPTLVKALAIHHTFSTLLSCLKALSRITSCTQRAAQDLFENLQSKKASSLSHNSRVLDNILKYRLSGVSVLLGILRANPKKYQLISLAAKALLSAAISGYENASTRISQTNPFVYRKKPLPQDLHAGSSTRRRGSRDGFFAGVATLVALLESLESEEDPLSGIMSPRSGVQARGTMPLLARQRKQRVEAQKAVCKLTFRLLSDSTLAAKATTRMPGAHTLLGSLLLRFGSQPDMEPHAQRIVQNTAGAINFSLGNEGSPLWSLSSECSGRSGFSPARGRPQSKDRARGHSRSRSRSGSRTYSRSRSRSRGRRTPSPAPLNSIRRPWMSMASPERPGSKNETRSMEAPSPVVVSSNLFLRNSTRTNGKMLDAIQPPVVRQGTAGEAKLSENNTTSDDAVFPTGRERSRSVPSVPHRLASLVKSTH